MLFQRLRRLLQTQREELLVNGTVSVDSHAFLAHATVNWPNQALFSLTLLLKIQGMVTWNWWYVFLPAWFQHVLQIPMYMWLILFRDQFIRKQLGPEPSLVSSPAAQFQYQILWAIRMRTYLINTTCSIIESAALCASKVFVCYSLEHGTLLTHGKKPSVRFLLSPIWIGWLMIIMLSSFKRNSKNTYNFTPRHLFFAFLLMLAYKIDDRNSLSWNIVFVIPWLWYAGIMGLAILVAIVYAKERATPSSRTPRLYPLLLYVGLYLLLVSMLPQFVSAIAVKRILQGQDASTTWVMVLLPCCLSWTCMWLSSVTIFYGLRHQEVVREIITARVNTWRLENDVDQDVRQEVSEMTQRRVREMSIEELTQMVEALTSDQVKPKKLKRVGQWLFQPISAESNPDQEVHQDQGNFERDADDVQVNISKKEDLQQSSTSSSNQSEQNCVICFDGDAKCVFMQCGHGGFCQRCACTLYLSNPKECPTCRQQIEYVLQVQQNDANEKFYDVIN